MKKIIYLIGGGDYRKNELKEINKSIKSNLTEKDINFLIIPFATKKERYNQWFEAIKNNYIQIKNFNFYILEDGESKNEMKTKIKNADIIFFTGGRPEILIEMFKKYDLINELRNYNGIIIGYSAGALALCKKAVVLKDKDYPMSFVINGIDLVNISVSVHYKKSEDGELFNFSRSNKIYAVPNKSAILIKENKILSIGQVISFYKNKKLKNTNAFIRN